MPVQAQATKHASTGLSTLREWSIFEAYDCLPVDRIGQGISFYASNYDAAGQVPWEYSGNSNAVRFGRPEASDRRKLCSRGNLRRTTFR